MNTNSFEKIINEAWNNKNQVNSKSSRKILNSISKTIELLDSGKIRVAENKNDESQVEHTLNYAIGSFTSNYYWSGSENDGSLNSNNCSNWTTASSSSNGWRAVTDQDDRNLISDSQRACNSKESLVCICY